MPQQKVRQSLVGQLVEKPQLLQRQLILARSSLNVTGDASLTVTTIVELMKIAPELSPTRSSALSEKQYRQTDCDVLISTVHQHFTVHLITTEFCRQIVAS